MRGRCRSPTRDSTRHSWWRCWETTERQRTLAEAARVLKPGGRLSVTELPGDPDFVPLAELMRLAAEAGLAFERRYGPRWYYTCNFIR